MSIIGGSLDISFPPYTWFSFVLYSNQDNGSFEPLFNETHEAQANGYTTCYFL